MKKKQVYHIYLEAIPRDNTSSKVEIRGGWFTWNNSSCNEYLNDRSLAKNGFIREYKCKEDCARVMDHMRRYGYPCRADPSFTIRKVTKY